ncbi:ribokinase-like isoform X1 [Centruroides sculpturatus]|uniref:ribokinase-like isoform X1 n=2 Tax=Centruroides sculpturatus TaxID=218467 RepID=UPI000C6DDA8B|nr:ribokinase-like isoform X1 [Centruroides sculpturatus]XP_023223119.1 ribokinase-like isoform X1 [Centruroides sculpturatus]
MDVVVIGGCVVDLISYADRFPVAGETLIGSNFSKGFGGKGANQCVMISRLGGRTAMIAKLGDDTFGKEYFECFQMNQINYEHVTVTTESSTSTATICVTKNGENSIIYVPGAVNCLSKEDIYNAEKVIAQTKVLLCCNECQLDVLLEALKVAQKHKVYTIVNAAPICPEPYDSVYPLCDILCVNEVEVEAITNLKVITIESAYNACTVLLNKGCNVVIITLGAKGAVFCTKDNPKPKHVPAKKVDAVDTTGAGDAFLGSLTYYIALHPNLSLEEKISRSCEIASVSVLSSGTQKSFPYRKELEERLFV